MTLVVTVYAGEGIVMASDSRVSYNDTTKEETRTTERMGIHFSDTTYKTFLLSNGSGISVSGNASLNGKTIFGEIERFANERIFPTTPISEIPGMLSGLFKEPTDTTFHVAGYEKGVQKVFVVNPIRGVTSHDTNNSGAVWTGESETLLKILSGNKVMTPNGEITVKPTEILWNFFTLQDMIDFARYAIETTANTMRFTRSLKTVGGPIDVLLIKPNGSEWISRKKLI